MAKHTYRICRLLPANCFSVFDHFMGLALERLTSSCIISENSESYQSKFSKKLLIHVHFFKVKHALEGTKYDALKNIIYQFHNK